MGRDQPPRLAVLFLRLCIGRRSYEAIVGDLLEEYATGTHSTWWFWKEALSAVPGNLRRKPERFEDSDMRLRLLDTVAADIRYGIRTLLKTPGLTGAILMATALGIGVNTGIFSLLNALVLRPLPVRDSGRVITIYQEYRNVKTRNIHGSSTLFSWSEYKQYRDSNQVLSGVAAYHPFGATFGSAQAVRTVQGQLVSCNYFSVLGRMPVLGRDFSLDNCKTPEASPYIVLSHAFWRVQFGMDRNILGQVVVINRHKFTVTGVAPEGFTGGYLTAADFWTPITMQETVMPDPKGMLDDNNLSWLYLIGRLNSGVSLDQARANIEVIAKRIDQTQRPRETKLMVHVANLFSLPEARQLALSVGAVLMFAVGLVLLIACANVANLLLARAAVRRREIAIRLSIGAGRARLVRQFLTESLLLSLTGGALGATLSFWTFGAFYSWMLPQLPEEMASLTLNLNPDIRMLLFSLGLSLATGITFGLLPALQATRLDLNQVLKHELRSAGWRSRGWLRSTLLSAQVAVCLVLLVAAGLIMRGLVSAQERDPGFAMQNVVTASFDLTQEGYNEERTARFFGDLTDQLRSQPGVQAMALAEVIPLSGAIYGYVGKIEGQSEGREFRFNAVTADYLPLLEIPIVHGRGFRSSENNHRAAVLIASESTARHLWPGAEPIGRRICFSHEKFCREVVGIAKDVYTSNLSKLDSIFVYAPLDHPSPGTHVLVRGPDPASLARQVRATVGGIDRSVLVDVNELKQNLKMWQAPSRISLVLSSALAFIALLLAATGIFGVVNYSVSQRTHEIGTRMALGANAQSILRLLISQSLRPVFIGALLGLAGAAAVSRILSSLLFGVSPLDPLTFVTMVLIVFAAAVLASYAPTARATRIDPAAALRHE